MQCTDLLDRFLSYVTIDTQSNDESTDFPSTKKQLNLAEKLRRELIDLGIADTVITQWGYVIGSFPGNQEKRLPVIALISHIDTSPDVTGSNVNPQIHRNYSGQDIVLSEKENVILKVSENPYLKEKKGKTIITTDGTTLLGADDKAGVAEIMSAITYLKAHPDIPRPDIKIVFTPDEEVGRGAEHITVKEIGADYGYTIDGGKIGEIELENFNAFSADITVRGINVHPGYAKGSMVNAIKIASEILEQLPKDSLSPETTELRQGYIHPNTISGQVEAATIKLLLRDFDGKGITGQKLLLDTIAADAQKKYPRAAITVTYKESYKNMKEVLDLYPVVIDKAVKAIEEAGLVAHQSLIRGGTDGARLCFMGLPCPNLFTGGNNYHSRFEWVALEDMQKATEVIVHLVQQWTMQSTPDYMSIFG
jgi:tripeptide aminopeptidase